MLHPFIDALLASPLITTMTATAAAWVFADRMLFGKD